MSNAGSRCLAIQHDSFFDYAEPTHNCVMLARLCPFQDRGQQLLSFTVETDPVATPIACDDGFSNQCHIFSIYRVHSHARVRSTSMVETAPAPALPDRLDPAAWDELALQAGAVRFWHYLAPSRFARPVEALERFAARNAIARGPDPLSTLRETCAALHACFVYEPGSTTVDSTIDSILETGAGVCQDYTHVMLTLGRSWGIPSRYVSGYLHLEGMDGEQSPRGASHAWAEFWLPEIGWVGFDPTNNTIADHRHVRIAHGRDYADAAPTRGVVYGGSDATVTVKVSIDAVEGKETGPPASSPAHTGRPWTMTTTWGQAEPRQPTAVTYDQ